MKLSRQEMESSLLSITREFLFELKAERALRAVSLNASLEGTLGIDSLGKVELFRRIEKNFSIQLSQEQLASVDTLNDLLTLVARDGSGQIQLKEAQTFIPKLEETTLDLSSAKTLVDVIRLYGENEPERPHLYLQDEHGKEDIIYYGELYQAGLEVAQGLIYKGIRAGETVAIMQPTGKDFFYAFCGVLLAGAIPVPIYPPFRIDLIEEYAQREAKILKNAQARILITFTKAELLGKILKSFVPSLTTVSTVDALRMKPERIYFSPKTDDIVLIQYTSGSTGDPKGVTLLHENMLANIRAIGKSIPINPLDTAVSWLPLYHDMGLMTWLASMYFGLPVTIMSPMTFLMRPERWLWAIHYHRATLSGGPNFSYELCVKKIETEDIEGLDISSWRFAFNGAEGINPKTLERFSKRFKPYGFKKDAFAPVYGLAESTVALTFPSEKREPRIDKIVSITFEKERKAIPIKATEQTDSIEFVACGKALIGHSIRIVDDSGYPLNERHVGNIQFKGPSSLQGYYNNPTATENVFDGEWIATGDLGYIAENDLFITGRKKDLIIKAGRNLYPESIEEIVNQVPNIRKGCVIAFGVSEAEKGTEQLIIVAETREKDKKEQQAIRNKINERVSAQLGIPPDDIILAPPHTVPKTSSGKLQRSAAKQAYLDDKLVRRRLPAKLQMLKLALFGASKQLYDGFAYLCKLIYFMYFCIVFILLVGPLWLGLVILPKKMAIKYSKWTSRNLLRCLGCPVYTIGSEYLNETSPMIYVANHTSYVDSVVLLGLLPEGVAFVAKKELVNSLFLRTVIKKLDQITIGRIDFAKNIADTQRIQKIIEQGRSIMIFPEGTFTYATGLRPFKLGAFTLAVNTKTPICPIAIKGTRSILRGDSRLPRPGKIILTVGKPIYPRSSDWEDVLRLHALTHKHLVKYCGEPPIDAIVAGLQVSERGKAK